MQIELFNLIQLGLLCRLVRADGVAERVLVGVEEGTFGVVVSGATVGVQGKDVRPNYGFKVEVSWFYWVEEFGKTVDRHFGWLGVDFKASGMTRVTIRSSSDQRLVPSQTATGKDVESVHSTSGRELHLA